MRRHPDHTPGPVPADELPTSASDQLRYVQPVMTFTPHPVAPPAQAKLEEPSGMNVMKLHVPLPAMVGVLVFFFGVVGSVALVWAKVAGHAEARDLHADVTEAIRGGGVAYKFDVASLRTDLQKQTRKLLKGMTIHCRQTPEEMRCTVELPED